MYDKVCKSCGTKLSAYLRTGMLGCPECYKAFREEILRTLEEIQCDTIHTGKSPDFSAEENGLFVKYVNLLKDDETAKSQGKEDLNLSEEIEMTVRELRDRGIL